eukprot:TRINITY_DN649_c1_g1_i2.p1 TRINITY_DN649_c1_g1~~TRINITY_DN649_c1_g1_i2.p1  ORF type:complete len:667 (+),score=163.82 TRINITY_DN649_c1_g1_i2:65-2065(+)
MRSAVLLTALAGSLAADPPAQRAAEMVKKMTTDEKIHMLHGSGSGYVGNVESIPRLGIPAIKMNDGPQGFRGESGKSTAYPSGLTVAASFDTAVLGKWGTNMGQEFYDKGANVQLGPGLCVARVPRNGRNFEYLSGEDPYLGYVLVQPAITGIQSQGVIANAKHYVNNNQESNRTTISENVDERTQFEMYYPPFEGAVEAGVGSVMCSYNKIRETWSCENPETLQRDLKERLGFHGWVMSDWGATHSPSINAGLDQEMPGSNYMGDALAKLVASGNVTMAKLDDSVQRILTPMYAMGVMDKENNNSIHNNVTSAAHNEAARDLSARSTVLLKNDGGILPLKNDIKTLAVIGDECANPIVHGGGSGQVVPYYASAPLDAIRAHLNIPAGKNCSTSGQCVHFVPSSGDVGIAAQADATLVCGATTSSEGRDRSDLSLQKNEDTLIANVAKVTKKVIVSTVTPGALLTPWREQIAAYLVPFMPGQEYGNALTEILFGISSPSARLPLTFPLQENDEQFTESQWPGINLQANYSEKLNFGYRWYATHKVKPAFAFGEGMTYTTFSYSAVKASNSEVSFTVKNTGSVDGVDTPQLYLGFPAEAGEPPIQLKGFSKVSLKAGESTTVTYKLNARSLSTWDVASHSWVQAKGTFTAFVGANSGSLDLSATFTN